MNLWRILLALSLVAGAVATKEQQPIFLNCGGQESYVDTKGNEWIGDNYTDPVYFSDGNAYRCPFKSATIKKTKDDELFLTERWDYKVPKTTMVYEIPVKNGLYEINLYFADIYWKTQANGNRVFNVWIEDEKVLKNYDIFKRYGGYTAVIETFETEITDKAMTISFEQVVQNPKISAISIIPLAGTSSPTASPSAMPSLRPSSSPSQSSRPSSSPSQSNAPTVSAHPSGAPSLRPTTSPTERPTSKPTKSPTDKPTRPPTSKPTSTPTDKPTKSPTDKPTQPPTDKPTRPPTKPPTADKMTASPTFVPDPTERPSSPRDTDDLDDSEKLLDDDDDGPSTDVQWNQVGQDIQWMEGEPLDDNSLAMSVDGQVVAIGQTQDDDMADSFTGRVDILRYNAFFNVWARFSDSIMPLGDDDATAFGFSVSLNKDGNVIAIGDPGNTAESHKGRAFVYEYSEDIWQQKGQVISPGGIDLYAGRTVAISADGNVVAVVIQNTGRTPKPPIFVRIFAYDKDEDLWVPIGQDVFARQSTANDLLSVDLCTDGSTIAISSLVPGSGYVEIYKYKSGSDRWKLMGEPILSKDETTEAVGITVAMSADGATVAFGVSLFMSPNLVRVYRYIEDDWSQLGEDINSDGEIGARRLSLSLSSNGETVAIGPQDQTPFSRVYGYDDEAREWSQIGSDIDTYELAPSGFQLQSVALSGSGSRVAVFGPGGQHVAVYDQVDSDRR